MDLSTWLERRGHGSRAWLSRESGVSTSAIFELARGRTLERLDKARAVWRATGGAVDLASLWGPAKRGEAVVLPDGAVHYPHDRSGQVA